jgi:four helix bundle protein
MGALFELQTQIEIALNLKYLQQEDFNGLFESSREIERMLSSLISKVKPDE